MAISIPAQGMAGELVPLSELELENDALYPAYLRCAAYKGALLKDLQNKNELDDAFSQTTQALMTGFFVKALEEKYGAVADIPQATVLEEKAEIMSYFELYSDRFAAMAKAGKDPLRNDEVLGSDSYVCFMLAATLR